MKALILDYTDASLLLITIPQEWEDNAEEFVRALPRYDDSCCYHIVTSGNTFDVYDIVQDGEDADGHPNYDYIKNTDL